MTREHAAAILTAVTLASVLLACERIAGHPCPIATAAICAGISTALECALLTISLLTRLTLLNPNK
jgi:predicted membrane chloride channel (bestrophin family)